MGRHKKLLVYGVFLSGLTMFLACGPENMPPAGSPEQANTSADDWMITGAVKNSGFGNGEIVAVSMDGNRYSSTIADNQSFGIELPGNATYAVYFVPKKSSHKNNVSASDFVNTVAGPKITKMPPALMIYEESPEIGLRNTLRLPKVISNNQIDLGEIDIKNSQAFPTRNPALSLDFDNDGLNDFSDQDDQNDGLFDKLQRDQLERVEICHLSANSGQTENIPLSMLLEHIEHGDTLGPCKITNQPPPQADTAPSMPTASAPEPNQPDKSEPADTGRSSGGHPIEKTPDEEDGDKEEDEKDDDKKGDDKEGGDKPGDDKGDDKGDDDKNGDDKDGDGAVGDEDKPGKSKPKRPRNPRNPRI